MVKAGCPKDGIVFDPFIGSGTVALVAKKLGRRYLGIELNQSYIAMAEKRINAIPTPMF
jgi:DNA modification methylase